MSLGWALTVSVLLLAANAFFVAAEFALVASKRHRLEEMAAGGSRAARAAVDGARHLSLMLAGAQLGITLATLGLGALAKPAVAELLAPLFDLVGLSSGWADAVAIVLAVALVVFLHMVIGEMAPKSWAISHPERSALLLALPFRAFTTITKPLLRWLNGMANALLRMVNVQPQDTVAQAHGPDDLRMLLRESYEHGLLPDQQARMLAGVLDVRRIRVADVMAPRADLVTVPVHADTAAIEAASRDSGRSRLVVLDPDRPDADPLGIVHVREAVRAEAAGRRATARELMTEALVLPAERTAAEAVAEMRARRAQLCLVRGGSGAVVGLAAMEDLLEEILGEFEDETDR
ncbi:hemolysin family protein [Actinokineospora sp. UTMC 2448]|uniref:hemolysin family protein n=1 Tax=Actinokineospora sp. UTMC 2448 TaxID=2268449 RepID=UPI00216404D7|nr:hemolysin family protein [Actinokineospora sp. UTMC 2448]UVS78995.1 Hemolysin C [Actinokineospora sp. UTMC 2448]